MSDGLVVLRRTRSSGRASEWSLVLQSQNLSPEVIRDEGSFAVALPEGQVEAAEVILATYEAENPKRRRRRGRAPATAFSQVGTLVMALVFGFFAMTGPHGGDNPWAQAGRADAAKILAGELERTVTALTLHADVPHAAGNAVLGALLINAVGGAFGPGVGAAAVLVSGAGGNLVNALVQGPGHRSLGASTAVFGALGLLCAEALRIRRRGGESGRRLWIPFAAGLGFIAMVGVGGERTDFWAHLFGFGSGFAFGVTLESAGRGRGAVQAVASAAALLAVLASWSLALAR